MRLIGLATGVKGLLLMACLGPPPREPHVVPDTAVVERAVLGAAVDMEISAITGCRTETRIVGLTNTSKHGAPGIGLRRESRIVGCRGQELSVQVSCSPRDRCDLEADEQQATGGSSIGVRLVREGLVKVTLESNNLESGQHRTKVRRFEVVPPTAFRLQCMTPALVWGSCESGVSAAQPLLRVLPMLDGKPVRTSLLRVNGRAGTSSTSFTTGQSLEPILDMSPIPPGRYELDISVGDRHEHANLLVE